MANPKIIKGTIEKIIVLKEGLPGQNYNGGHYDEIKYLLRGQDGKLYVSYWSSADFDYCPLWGTYTQCTNCFWWWENWLGWATDGNYTPEEIADLHPCQDPDLTLIETEKRIFWARKIDEKIDEEIS